MRTDIAEWLEGQSETGRNLFTLLHEHSGLRATVARAKVEIVLSEARKKAESEAIADVRENRASEVPEVAA